MKALIFEDKLIEVNTVEFEVHEAMTWMDCPDDCLVGSWEYVDGALQVIPEPEDTRTYAEKRKQKYNALNQFELMTDDAANSTTTHADAIAAIKAEFPKP